MPKTRKRLSLLLNPIRRRIYEVVCESPGIHFYRIASELATSQGTLDWHLRQLEKDGLLNSTKFWGKRIYFPRMLSNVESARALAALRSKTAQEIFRLVINTPGKNQQEIANVVGVHHDTVRYHLTRFEGVGLVERYRDGREVRVFLGKLGDRLVSGSLELVSEHFVTFLVQKLKEGCLTPIVTSQDKDHVSLRVNCPDGENFEITITLAGWDFLLSDEKKDDSDYE
ncbi:MAG: winged helix-turn-helix transcriptional regulator [Candidatus Hodarchaeota archaeon]